MIHQHVTVKHLFEQFDQQVMLVSQFLVIMVTDFDSEFIFFLFLTNS